jgi:hypothetical protein
MKRTLIALTLGLATLTLAACDDGYGYGGIYSASYYPHYRYNDGYYDGYYYAPATRGYWSGNRYYYRRGDGHHHVDRNRRDWRRDGDARGHRWKDDDRGNRGRGKRDRDRD